jgi:YD repeat-containing protein
LHAPRQTFSCSGKGDTTIGNPCDPATGAKRHIEVDYAGSGDFPLRFVRTYNSLVWIFPGRKFWRHSYERSIDLNTDGTVPVAAVHRQDGTSYLFREDTGIYVTNADVSHRLEKLVDGSGQLSGWRLTEAADDSVETYDAAGRLLEIARRDGRRQVLEYSDSSTPVEIAPVPGLLVRVTDHYGRALQLRYDLKQRLVKLIDPAGEQFVYTWVNSTDNLIADVTYPEPLPSGLPAKKVYKYGDAGWGWHWTLTGIIDENNSRVVTWNYDSSTRIARVENAGAVNRYDIIATNGWNGNQRRITDPRGTIWTYNYQIVDGVYHLSSITNASGLTCPSCGPKSASYDAQGNVSQRVDWNNNRTNFTHDLTRNLETSRTEGLTLAGAVTLQTRTISTEWHPDFRLATRVAEPLRITTFTYNGESGASCGYKSDGVTLVPGVMCGKTVQATTDANGSQAFGATPTGTPRIWAYTYNHNGQLLTANGPRTDVTDVTTYTYYADDDADLNKRGHISTISNAAGHLTSITAYNEHGQPLTIIDANGMTTTLAYDKRQRLISRNAGGEFTEYDYHGTGLLKKVTLADGSYLVYGYDAAHRLTSISDNEEPTLANKITYVLDVMGNRTSEQVTDPAGVLAQKRTRVYNSANRLFQELGALNQTTEYLYNGEGQVTSVKDPLTHTTTSQYDALNRLKQVTGPLTVTGQPVTQYIYNGLDALTQITDPRNLVTGYTVDGLGNLTQQASPDTGTTINTYDAAGNLLTQEDAKSQTTTYVYDVLNRVSSVTFHDGSKHTYNYDQGTNGVGRLSSVVETNPAMQVISQIAYSYDLHGRLNSETRALNGITYVTGYGYDSAGRLNSMTYPSGRTLTYGFDTLGRVNQVTTTKNSQSQTVVQNVTYHPFGGVKGYTLGNGRVYSRGVDLDGRIQSYTLGTKTYNIGYDAASRIEFISDADFPEPANRNNYSYDQVDRLISAQIPGTNYSYAYDAVGNRKTRTAGAGTDTYAYSTTSNRITGITGSSPARSFVFDPNGSTTADGNNTYVYDVRGRMTQATSSLGLTNYQVNALGQRIRKTNSLGDILFHYDSRGRLIAESDPGGPLKREYIYLGDIPVGVVQ